ncbi:translocon-associated protein beta (TRAPB) family protein [Actinidia rufa]|uniref:Translocon-associated protein beta (TRAPB) family protein n=1 Tax=Actinidia rufa TaxID=165716 RepID=A0A7J0GBA6_9ERIC|nr:translocon-associated protein beta (TRAPB) family protein [Actinidia rufa]
MAIPSKLIIFTLSSLLLISETIAISESPFIVAHKKASLTKLKSGAERVSVSIDIYNRGSAAAYDVSLTDNSWSQEVFEFVSGNTTKSWNKLEAGSLVSHSFELESKLKAAYNGAPAVITFRIPTKAKLQEAYSTPILPLDILADKMPETMFKLRFLAKHGSLISVICIVALSAHLITSPSKSSDAKGSKKRR